MSKFVARTTAPSKDNKWWYSDVNPYTKKGIGTCTRNAQARFMELQNACTGKTKTYKDTWYPIDMYNRCSEVGGVKVSKPVLGGAIVWIKKDKSMSHIGTVEAIKTNGDITVFQCSSKEVFSCVTVTKTSGYKLGSEWKLVGFIDLQLKWDSTTSTTNETKTNTTKTMWYVQCGAFTSKTNAKKRVTALKKDGVQSICKYDGKYYRIQCGAYESKSNASNMVNKLKGLGYASTIVTEIKGTQVTL